MDTIHLISENLAQSEQIVLSRIEEMREHCLVPPSSRGGCHTLWVLGHLAYIERLVVHQFPYLLGHSLLDIGYSAVQRCAARAGPNSPCLARGL